MSDIERGAERENSKEIFTSPVELGSDAIEVTEVNEITQVADNVAGEVDALINDLGENVASGKDGQRSVTLVRYRPVSPGTVTSLPSAQVDRDAKGKGWTYSFDSSISYGRREDRTETIAYQDGRVTVESSALYDDVRCGGTTRYRRDLDSDRRDDRAAVEEVLGALKLALTDYRQGVAAGEVPHNPRGLFTSNFAELKKVA